MSQFFPVNMDFLTDCNKSSAEPYFGVQVKDKYSVYAYLEWGYMHKDYPTSTAPRYVIYGAVQRLATSRARRKRKIVLLELFNTYIKTKQAMIYRENLCTCICVHDSKSL